MAEKVVYQPNMKPFMPISTLIKPERADKDAQDLLDGIVEIKSRAVKVFNKYISIPLDDIHWKYGDSKILNHNISLHMSSSSPTEMCQKIGIM